eukprot:COSAG05_NODE_2988_length_2434_cov_5.364026_2_plen_110_part_00
MWHLDSSSDTDLHCLASVCVCVCVCVWWTYGMADGHCRYRADESVEITDDAPRLGCQALKTAYESGELTDATPLRVAGGGKDSGWQDWATFGAYTTAYAGFRQVLCLPI